MNKLSLEEVKRNRRKAIEAGKRVYLGKPCKNKEHHVDGGSIRGLAWDKEKKCWKGKSCVKCTRIVQKKYQREKPESIEAQKYKAQKKKNKEQAIKEGNKAYKRVRPCKKCGGMENGVSSDACIVCARKRDKEDTPIVYLIRNKDKEIIYIGETSCPKSRFYMHKNSNSKWIKEFGSLDIILCKDSLTMTVLEDLLISAYTPKYNVRLRGSCMETQNQLFRTFQSELRVISRHRVIDEIMSIILE